MKQEKRIFNESLAFGQFKEYVDELFHIFPKEIMDKMYNLKPCQYRLDEDKILEEVRIANLKDEVTMLRASCNEMVISIKIRHVESMEDLADKPILKCKILDNYKKSKLKFSFAVKTIDNKLFLECKKEETINNKEYMQRSYRDIDVEAIISDDFKI